ncbi:hypothetical protein IWX48DRAFT_208719 [Phyllosticta citricarpa]
MALVIRAAAAVWTPSQAMTMHSTTHIPPLPCVHIHPGPRPPARVPGTWSRRPELGSEILSADKHVRGRGPAEREEKHEVEPATVPSIPSFLAGGDSG